MTRPLLPLPLLFLAGLPALAQDDTGPPTAAAEDIPVFALVPLDGAPGTSSRDMEVVVRGLTQELTREGDLAVVSGPTLVDQLTAGKQAELQSARDAFTEGQLMLGEGDADIGLAFLSESIKAHGRAGSPVVRREEMANAAFILARALLEVGRDDDARDALTRALRLLPDYLDTQTEAADPALRTLAKQVEADLSGRPPRRLSPRGARTLAQDLQVDGILHGVVLADGTLRLTVFRDGEAVHVQTVPGPFDAPRLGDPFYAELATPLRLACLGRPLPEAPGPVPPPPSRARGTGIALAITGTILAAGAATAAVIAVQQREGPQESWELDVNVVR